MIADAHVCKLEERFDNRLGALRWSMPRKEICHCQAVVAPRKTDRQSCLRENDPEMEEDHWFTDDPTPLVNRRNWNWAKLDQLLNRTYCCTLHFNFFFVSVYC